MRRHEVEHVLRAAAAITDETDFVLLGSQSVLGQLPDAPSALLRSNEIDIYPDHAPEKAEIIDGAIGAGSLFQDNFGYYADAVGPETAKLPKGWRSRAFVIAGPNTGGARGICPEIHDLAVAKLVAGREKDRDWLVAAAEADLLDRATMRSRLEAVDGLDSAVRAAAGSRLVNWLG
jgi:hypothetical protein